MEKKVFSLRIASSLIEMGYKIKRTEINAKNVKLLVFVFYGSEELDSDFNKLCKK
ncbi:MAG: hypothetical protein ACRCXT_03935 [Paraclostridium sp.]